MLAEQPSSVAVTVKQYTPLFVGVPLSTPPGDNVTGGMPGGREPDVTVNVYGVPLGLAVMV
jgi:hypothetical protein